MQLEAEPFGDSTVAAAIDILAGSGVATFADALATQPMAPVVEPVSPFQLLRDQVRNMALEAHDKTGIEGDELDALVDSEADVATPAYILAGYVAAGDTPGAALSRELMGDQDWTQAPALLFPQLVLVLFTADVVHQRQLEAARPTIALAAFTGNRDRQPPIRNHFAPVAAATPCSDVSNFITNALTSVFRALRLGEPANPVAGFFVKIWNFVVSVFESIARAIIDRFKQAVFDQIAKVAAVVATVASVISAVRQWAVTIHANPDPTEKGIPGIRPREQGALVARVDLGGFDEWPSWAQDCANNAHVTLPNLKPQGAPISWTTPIQNPPALVEENGRGRLLDANGSARFEFTTLDDVVEDPYQTYPGAIHTRVTIERQSLRDLAKLATGQLLSGLPPIIVGPLLTFLGPSINSVLASLGRLITVQGSGPATVLFHVTEATPIPSLPAATDGGEFCRRYRDYWSWALAQGEDVTRANAAEIERRFRDMRPYAPTQLLADVDLVIDIYGTFASAPEPFHIPIAGQHGAERLPAALNAMHAYCGMAPPF